MNGKYINRKYGMGDVSNALFILSIFKEQYTEKDGVITIGDIRNLIDNIDLMKCCLGKQKPIPANYEAQYKLFGELEYIPYCNSCGRRLYPKQGSFCPKCGQMFL